MTLGNRAAVGHGRNGQHLPYFDRGALKLVQPLEFTDGGVKVSGNAVKRVARFDGVRECQTCGKPENCK